MNAKDMTPILPYSVWHYGDHGIVVVTDSSAITPELWKITFIDFRRDCYNIEMPYLEWLEKASFRGELLIGI